ncbi:C6 transcription factor [Penicillium lagena]|uniref:C6 transcription factor n=1 Tax=Penicillium lagena TaxID=94218 RepID=UPI002540DC88|nr:C6 transcription factor [Penicillium lagena]KAJ5606085.1 C6 transcription factor [Penicillium lagena]
MQACSPDIHRFFVRLGTTTLAGETSSPDNTLRAYFATIHLWFPVIQEQIFRRRLSQLQHTPRAETALLFLTVSLIMTGETGINGGDDYQSQLYYLCRYLFSFLQSVRPPSLELVQVGLLLVLYELGSARFQAASLNIGTCARLGYVLKLNTDPQEGQDYSSWAEAEERRRVWLGTYMLDCLINQVATDFQAPRAVDKPVSHFRLPVDDREWEHFPEGPVQCFFQPSFSTPLDTPLSYFAREIQGVHILGQVQALQNLADSDCLLREFGVLDNILIRFMEKLFEQTPGSWKTLCGANAIALMAALSLHRIRVGFGNSNQGAMSYCSEAFHAKTMSILALSSIINMVWDICSKFNELQLGDKIRWVPLPAVICAGETAITAVWLNRLDPGRSQLDYEPLRQTLSYATRTWDLAGKYLQRIG